MYHILQHLKNSFFPQSGFMDFISFLNSVNSSSFVTDMQNEECFLMGCDVM
jgi:hypothetical protein